MYFEYTPQIYFNAISLSPKTVLYKYGIVRVKMQLNPSIAEADLLVFQV